MTDSILPINLFREIASLSEKELLIIYSLRSSTCTIKDLVSEHISEKEVKNCIEKLIEKGYVTPIDSGYVLQPKGAILSALLYYFYYTIAESGGKLTYEDAETKLNSLATKITVIEENMESLRKSLDSCSRALTILRAESEKIAKIMGDF